jgi:hypothetical protein
MTAQFTNEEIQGWTTKPTAPASHGRIREAIHRIRCTVQEMNYASRRVVEVQAPWSVDKQWHRR